MNRLTGIKSCAVCLCADAHMLIPSLFVADSVRKQSRHRPINIDVLIFAPPQDIAEEHRFWASRRGISLRTDLPMEALSEIRILNGRLSSATLMKLLMPAQLAGCYEKVLYLDADTIIRADVSAIFALEMGDSPIAAVPSGRLWLGVRKQERDRWLTHFSALGMSIPYRYFNSGVMLINIDSWNKQKLGARALAFIRSRPELCFHPDEDALNAILDGRFMELSPIWNMRPEILSYMAFIGEPVILHYAGPVKPWRRFAKGKRLLEHRDAYRLYKSFVANTPWPRWLEGQWDTRDLVASIQQELRYLFTKVSRDAPAQNALEQWIADQKYADVEQGITVRNRNALALADA